MNRQHWRSVLFVPGDRPDRVAKATRCGADAVAIDLEDAVPLEGKDQARIMAVEQLRAGLTGPVLVRVNAVDSGLLERDIEQLRPVWPQVDGVLLAKAESGSDVLRLEQLFTGMAVPAMVPIVETAVGVFEARSTAAASPQVATLLFGPADLSADLGVEPTAEGNELANARAQVVLAAAAAGLRAPLDGPHLVLGDRDGLIRATHAARTLGFGGKVVIHPEQIPAVHKGFGPRTDEITWAQQVVAASAAAAADGSAVCRLDDGTFVDEPILRRAKALLDDYPDTRQRAVARGASAVNP
ncbi:HpcH/HpaI aldolase/citrate lyase family protein [Sciscionella marina]|uniref:HpcH/HpaI aldolase/citrate lyase family protein n=1 Tax=Sciscionella marina TaxID=508770 RepID=UPI0003637614|nr:CoA ester lyase [Sciscionella marina]